MINWGLGIVFVLIEGGEDGGLGNIVIRIPGRDELTEIESFAPGSEVALAGSPVSVTTPVFFGMEDAEEYDECGEDNNGPEDCLEEALHPVLAWMVEGSWQGGSSEFRQEGHERRQGEVFDGINKIYRIGGGREGMTQFTNIPNLTKFRREGFTLRRGVRNGVRREMRLILQSLEWQVFF